MATIPTPTVTWTGGCARLEMEQRLPLPPARLFSFFADAHNLERITPAFLRFTVLTPRPVAMGVGALIDYRLRLRGIPIRWRTEIAEWRPPHAFVDRQLRGPYALWRHEHVFTAEGDGTRCRDRVTYRPPGGPLARLVDRALVRRDVIAIFRHRAAALAEIFADAAG